MEPGLSMLTNGLADARGELDRSASAGADGIGGLGAVFGAPDALAKIAANPMTASYLADPDFMMKFQELRTNPSSINKHLSDQRILQARHMRKRLLPCQQRAEDPRERPLVTS